MTGPLRGGPEFRTDRSADHRRSRGEAVPTMDMPDEQRSKVVGRKIAEVRHLAE
jgi:hypothetical protein